MKVSQESTYHCVMPLFSQRINFDTVAKVFEFQSWGLLSNPKTHWFSNCILGYPVYMYRWTWLEPSLSDSI